MKTTHLILSIVLLLFCSSCYSYKIYPKEYMQLTNEGPKPRAFIINDTLKKELEILAYSDLFTIVADSMTADVDIRLYPLDRNFVCGMGISISIFTLGQLPILFPDRYYYRFDEIRDDTTTERKLELDVAQRMWFWDVFVFNKRFEEKAGKALLGAYKDISK